MDRTKLLLSWTLHYSVKRQTEAKLVNRIISGSDDCMKKIKQGTATEGLVAEEEPLWVGCLGKAFL